MGEVFSFLVSVATFTFRLTLKMHHSCLTTHRHDCLKRQNTFIDRVGTRFTVTHPDKKRLSVQQPADLRAATPPLPSKCGEDDMLAEKEITETHFMSDMF